jgi:hypothetical protein
MYFIIIIIITIINMIALAFEVRVVYLIESPVPQHLLVVIFSVALK